jgi:hypothetical protein
LGDSNFAGSACKEISKSNEYASLDFKILPSQKVESELKFKFQIPFLLKTLTAFSVSTKLPF